MVMKTLKHKREIKINTRKNYFVKSCIVRGKGLLLENSWKAALISICLIMSISLLSACGIFPSNSISTISGDSSILQSSNIQTSQTSSASSDGNPTVSSDGTPTVTPTVTPPVYSQSQTPVTNIRNGWAYTPSGKQGVPSKTTSYRMSLCDMYDGIWQGDTTKKKVYITMDVGYEYNNNTTRILDIAKSKNFKINFFITGALFKTEALKALVLRMSNEGHLVGNHTWNHPGMPTLLEKSGESALNAELDKIETAFLDLTGHKISSYMRPPMGEFSEATLQFTQRRGYKTVFWSFAYEDWLTDKQPPVDKAKQKVLAGLHNGVVFLLHAVSNTNVEILPDLVDQIRSSGYEIALVSDIK